MFSTVQDQGSSRKSTYTGAYDSLPTLCIMCAFFFSRESDSHRVLCPEQGKLPESMIIYRLLLPFPVLNFLSLMGGDC